MGPPSCGNKHVHRGIYSQQYINSYPTLAYRLCTVTFIVIYTLNMDPHCSHLLSTGGPLAAGYLLLHIHRQTLMSDFSIASYMYICLGNDGKPSHIWYPITHFN